MQQSHKEHFFGCGFIYVTESQTTVNVQVYFGVVVD